MTINGNVNVCDERKRGWGEIANSQLKNQNCVKFTMNVNE